MTLDKKFFAFIFLNAFTSFYIYKESSLLHGLKVASINLAYNFIVLFCIYLVLDFTLKAFNRWHIYIYKTIKNFLIFWCMFCALLQCLLFKNFNTTFLAPAFDVILSTNPAETKEFFTLYGNVENCTFIIIYIIICAVIFYIKDFCIAIRFKFGVIFCMICVIVIAFLGYKDYKNHYEPNAIRTFLKEVNILSFLYSSIVSIEHKQTYIKQYKQYREKLDSNLAKYTKEYIISNRSSIPNVVMIIGESVQRNFMHIYGYKLPNTPHLDALQKNGNLFVFRDVISPAPYTSASLQKVLTFSDYENRNEPWYKFMNIIDAMKMTGYKSLWISNQDVVSAYDNAPNTIATRSDFRFFTQLVNFIMQEKDGKTLELYDKYIYLMQKYNKRFFIFHLLQSHPFYQLRFPSNFSKFNPSDIDSNIYHLSKDKSERQKNLQIIADYVNSIYYDDYILNEIIERFKDKNAIIFYFSDHGQDIFQTGFFVGHKLSKYGLEVPFMIYVSPKFKAQYPQKVELIKNALNKPFMMDDFIHGFLSILDIKTKDNIESKDIFSDKFDVKRERIVDGFIYEK